MTDSGKLYEASEAADHLPRTALLVRLWCRFKTILTTYMFAGDVGGSNPLTSILTFYNAIYYLVDFSVKHLRILTVSSGSGLMV